MSRLFGTDGVRGRANADLTPELALKLNIAAARVLGPIDRRAVAVVGRDPRASGEMLQAASAAGLAAAGVEVIDLGVLPTPAVAHLTAVTGADFGVMISASHNPMPDNGIKFFSGGGRKLPDEVEDAIERAMDEPRPLPQGADVGRIIHSVDPVETYIQHLVAVCPSPINGLKVVVDPANGAAANAAPEALRRAGAEVIAINNDPDGLNINDNCGSTHMDGLRAAVVEHGADAGIALDGDADRCLAVDAKGNIVDGDAIMAILALAMRDAGQLRSETLVTTVMSNLGLHQAMGRAGIKLETTKVGDRYVLERLAEGDFSLGGEQSGHIIMSDHGTTGDGSLTAIMLLSRMAATGKSLAELASVFTPAPQVLINVRVADKSVIHAESVKSAVAEWQRKLGADGRILLRPSGTEPLVRVMVEAPEEPVANSVAAELASVVENALIV
ncbi:phosphoglucosamine mutase [Glycomyces buryatensis]|uniref:Phosphoglucosamine mutase n=1 Tax=Glycomyces buryatensis TaxID=2570927 RepID=A0A4S8QE54_9ACTN|nr:phosphoglucosamine mutase [Glycomyces buryatensis]THV42863.1 phosphoglucosamine mutase [Glycomyces buryatensis]